MPSQSSIPLPQKRRKSSFAWIALVGLALIAVGIVALDRIMRAHRDRETIQWAEQAMKEGRYEDATLQFARAVARHPDDADLSIRSGDAFYALSASKPEALPQARVAWQAALRVKPDDLPAMQRLLQFQIDLAEVRPTPISFRELGDAAQTLLAISPANKQAATARLIASLGPWFSQFGSGTPSESSEHEKLLGSLADLVSQSPPDELAIIYCALASSRRAVELEGDSSAHQILDRAEHQIVDAADRDPRVLYRAAEGLTILAEANRRIDQLRTRSTVHPATSQPAATRPAATQPAATQPAGLAKSMWPRWDTLDWQVRWEPGDSGRFSDGRSGLPTTRPINTVAERCEDEARAFASRAAQRLAPSDDHFVESGMLEVHLALAAGDRRAAERICQRILAAHPASLRAQLTMAELIADSDAGRAMALLSQPQGDENVGRGPIALTRRELQSRAAMLKARLYLDAASSADDSSARQAYLTKAGAACDELAAMLVNDAGSVKLTGRLRMLQGRYAEAVRLLDRAAAMWRGPADADLFSWRAASLLELHESQSALNALRVVLQLDPSRFADRLLLAQTLIQEDRITEAASELDLLERQSVHDERVLELRVRFLLASSAANRDSASVERIRAVYSMLPEGTVRQKLAKADLALSAGQAEDAIRLLQLAKTAEPASIPVTVELVRAMIASGRRDEARSLLAAEVSKHPGDAALAAAGRLFSGPLSPEQFDRSVNGDNAKDFLAAIHRCRAALDAHDLARAKEEIDNASKIRPDEPALFDVKFRYDLERQNWGDAGVCVDRLAQANSDGMDGLSYEFRRDVERGQPFAATCVAREMTSRFGDSAVAWRTLGQALRAEGQYELAIASLNRALELEHDSIATIKELIGCLEPCGRMQEVDQWITKGRQLAPNDSDLRAMQLSRQLSQGDPHRLIAARKAVLASGAKRPEDVIGLARVYLRINAIENLSHPSDATELIGEATDLLKDAVKQWPDDDQCALWAAHAAALSGDVPDGKQILRRLCDRPAWSTRPEAEQLLADFCLQWGDPRAAEAALREAIKRGATGPAVAQRLATASVQLGSWQAALDALRDYPDDPAVQQQRILIFIAAGKAREAESELQSDLIRTHGGARVMSLLGMLYLAGRDDAGAKLWLDRAFAAGDEEFAGRARGALQLREKTTDLPRAIQDLAIAQEAHPSDMGATVLLAEACLRNHDELRAKQLLQTALTITPSNKDIRWTLISLQESAAVPDWAQIETLIEAGRSIAPSDWDWDVAASRMWLARHQPGTAAAFMHRAVQLAGAAPEVADVALESQDVRRIRTLIPEELWMLLQAQAYDATLAEADKVISRYGQSDMLAAWAHQAKAAVERRTGREDGGTTEYNKAIGTAYAAGGFKAASQIIETISSEAGADEAVRRINLYLAIIDRGGGHHQDGRLAHDAGWDLLRADLLRRNNEIHAAALEIDKLIPHLAELPADAQVQLLRMAVVIYLQDASVGEGKKAAAACLALLQRVPDDAWALNNMAAICIDYSNPSQPQKAIQYGQHAYQVAERAGEVDPQIVDTYGWALAVGGRGSEAIQILNAVAPRLETPDFEYHLAEAYLASGDPRSAWPHLESSLRLIHRDEKQGRRIDGKLRSGVANACWHAIGETAMMALGAQIR